MSAASPMRSTTYRCAGSDFQTWQESTAAAPLPGWLVLSDGRAGDPVDRDFCTVDCLLRWAATVEPVTVIEWERGVA